MRMVMVITSFVGLSCDEFEYEEATVVIMW